MSPNYLFYIRFLVPVILFAENILDINNKFIGVEQKSIQVI